MMVKPSICPDSAFIWENKISLTFPKINHDSSEGEQRGHYYYNLASFMIIDLCPVFSASSMESSRFSSPATRFWLARTFHSCRQDFGDRIVVI